MAALAAATTTPTSDADLARLVTAKHDYDMASLAVAATVSSIEQTSAAAARTAATADQDALIAAALADVAASNTFSADDKALAALAHEAKYSYDSSAYRRLTCDDL